MATINEEYAAIENAIKGMPEGLYAVMVEGLDFVGETTLLFAAVESDGDWSPLGKATQNDRLGGWEGTLDTKHVSFEDEEGLQVEFRRVMREEAVVL